MRINQEQKSLEEVKELIATFDSLSGWAYWKELIKWVLTGVFMGTSDAIPGYSGGTTLALLGLFKRLILIAKSVFVPEKGITRMKALTFMLPFMTGWIIGIFGFAKLTEYMAHHGLGLELVFMFSAFITFAIPVFLRGENPKLKRCEQGSLRRRFIFILGFFVVIGLSLWVFIGDWNGQHKGIKFTKDSNKIKTHYDLRQSWWPLMIVAFGSGAVTLIPGGSGAIVQLLSGKYDDIHWTIMAHPIANFGSLVIFAMFTLLGMLTIIFIFTWALKHISIDLAALSFGMLVASAGAVLLVPELDAWYVLSDWRHIIGTIFAWVIGASAAISIQYIVKRNNEYN